MRTCYQSQIAEPVEDDFLSQFENQARERLGGRDEDDWPVLAAALGLGCPIWTEDQDFFGTGRAVCTTSKIAIFSRRKLRDQNPMTMSRDVAVER